MQYVRVVTVVECPVGRRIRGWLRTRHSKRIMRVMDGGREGVMDEMG